MNNPVLQALRSHPPMLPALEDGDRALSYGELDGLVAAECRWLVAQEVQRCATFAENGCGWAIADLALLALQRLHVPLPTFFTTAQAAHALDDAGIDAVLTDQPDSFVAQHPQFHRVGASPASRLALLRRSLLKPGDGVPQGVIKITYTSGSTGTPKGVALSAAAQLQVAASLALAVRDAGVTRHLSVLPLATLLENISGIYVPLLLGVVSLLLPSSQTGLSYGALDPQRFLALLRSSRANSITVVPELLQLLVRSVEAGMPALSLKFVAVGGATVSVQLLQQAEAAGIPTYEGYGLSECASVVCLNTPSSRRVGSVGRPLPHARVRVDSAGEIHVAGAVMSGYVGRPASGVEPPAADEIATGDLGEIDADGYVYVRGRLRNMFITSMGRNVTPEWVESELLQEAPLSHAMVVGEGRPYAVALLGTRSAAVSDAQIESAVTRANARLPDYARVRRWARLDAAPSANAGLLTANGRLRRDAMLARYGVLLEPLYIQASAGEKFNVLS